MTPRQALNELEQIHTWLKLIHSSELPPETEIVYQQIRPDQVESIQIIHLAASIAALESEC